MGTFGEMTMPEYKGCFLNLTYSQHINGLMFKRTLANIQFKKKKKKRDTKRNIPLLCYGPVSASN